MTDTRTLHGRILTPLGWRRGHVHFGRGRLAQQQIASRLVWTGCAKTVCEHPLPNTIERIRLAVSW